jgi:hypothetical protein
MKKSELQQLIKEEISKSLNESNKMNAMDYLRTKMGYIYSGKDVTADEIAYAMEEYVKYINSN